MTHPMKATFLTMAALMLSCLAPGALAFSAVGNPNDNSGPDLSAAIMAAYNAGAAGVTINPGTYTLNQPNTTNTFGDPNLDLSNISHPFEIDAYNVELVLPGNHAGINCNYDTGLVIKGLTLDRRMPFGNQGVIQALGADSGGAYCDVQNDAGYPTSTANYYYSTVLVGNSHAPRVGCPDLAGGTVTDLGNNRVRVHFTNIGGWGSTTAQVGDYLVCCAGGAPLIKFVVCNNCTLQNTTFLSSPCEATIIDYQGTGNHYFNDTITYGPPPPGATVAPMRTIGSGLQAQDNYVGPDVENCYFEGTGDDGYDLHGDYVAVKSVSGNTVTVAYNYWLWHLVTASHQEPIRLSNGAGEYLDTSVLQQQVSQDGSTETLTLAAAPPGNFAQASPLASNPNMNCPGYRFINDTVRDSRARGVVARGDNGLIQNCTFINNLLPGVLIALDPGNGFTESDYSHNVTVQNNVFNNDQGIYIGSVGARGNQNITVTGNVFANTPGSNDIPSIAAQGVAGLTVSNNTFANLGQQTSSGGQQYPNSMHAVNITNSSRITLGGNLLTNPGANTASPVYAVNSTSQQSITGMNAGSFADLIYPREYVTLTDVAAGLNLDDPNYSTQQGTLLQLYPADGVSAQNWQVNWQADGSCTLTNQASNGLVLDDTAYGGAGTYQQLWPVDGATAQEWWFIPSGSSSYTLKNVSAALYLDDPYASTKSGTQVWLNAGNGNTAENWQVKPAPASSGTAQPGATLTQGQYLVSPHGKCYLIQQGDGNLVLYAGSGPGNRGNAIWGSGNYTTASGNVYTLMQTDGNLVTYTGTPSAPKGAVWSSGTYGNAGAYLAVTDDGHVQVLSTSGTTLWQRP